jgi:mediator of RNA polymerase II transcription subunit 14
LTNASVLDTLRRLDAHILYRLRCVDYVPPDIRIDKIQDGRAYVTGGKGQWHAEISLTGFGTGMQGRYWLTGIEWGWRTAGDDGKQSMGKRFKGNERQQILDLVNREILPPEDAGHDPSSMLTADAKTGVELGNTPQPGITEQLETKAPAVVDAPLVRLVNFIRKLACPCSHKPS